MAATTPTTPPTGAAPVPITAGDIAVSEDGIDVLLTIVLHLGTNEALDLCLRMIAATARVKRMAQP